MKKALIVAIYTFAVGLVMQGWLSSVLPLSKKVLLTLGALALVVVAFALQAKWRKDIAQ